MKWTIPLTESEKFRKVDAALQGHIYSISERENTWKGDSLNRKSTCTKMWCCESCFRYVKTSNLQTAAYAHDGVTAMGISFSL